MKVITPSGVVIEGKPVTHKSGEQFIRDPQSGGFWRLSDCTLLSSTDQQPENPSEVSSPTDPPPRDPATPIVELIPGDRCKVCRGSQAGSYGTVIRPIPGGYKVRLDGGGVVDVSYFQLGLTDWDPDPSPPPQADPLSRTITAEEWGSLKAAAACLGLTGADLLSIVKAVTGQTRGSLITLRQMEQIWDAAEQLYLERQRDHA
jgi:AraC-like DNA-binding protein